MYFIAISLQLAPVVNLIVITYAQKMISLTDLMNRGCQVYSCNSSYKTSLLWVQIYRNHNVFMLKILYFLNCKVC